jgi:hypothetical protein
MVKFCLGEGMIAMEAYATDQGYYDELIDNFLDSAEMIEHSMITEKVSQYPILKLQSSP